MCGSMADIQSAAVRLGEEKKEERKKKELECGPMPNVMVALPNIGGALYESLVMSFLVSHRKVCLTPAAGVPCSNAAKTRNPLKLPWVPQTNETIPAASGPKFTIL